MNDHKNTILAIVLSAIVLIAWQYFYGLPQMQKQKQAEAQKTAQTTVQQKAPPPGTTAQPQAVPQSGQAPTACLSP